MKLIEMGIEMSPTFCIKNMNTWICAWEKDKKVLQNNNDGSNKCYSACLPIICLWVSMLYPLRKKNGNRKYFICFDL